MNARPPRSPLPLLPGLLLPGLLLPALLLIAAQPAAAQTTCIDDTQVVDVIQRIHNAPPADFESPPVSTAPDAPTDATLDEPNGRATEGLTHGVWVVVRGGRVREGAEVAERTLLVGRVYISRTGEPNTVGSVQSSFSQGSTRSSLALRALVGQLLLLQLTGDRATVCHVGDTGVTLLRRYLPPAAEE